MRNPNREIDKTFLSLDLAEERGILHRDYISHCLRWSHVVKFMLHGHKYKDAIVLDVGCGKEMPLAKTLYVNKMSVRHYVGVDANDFEIPAMLRGKKMSIEAWSCTDFCALRPSEVGLYIGKIPQLPGYEHVATYGRNSDKNRGTVYVDHDGSVARLPNVLTCFEVLEHVTPEHCRRMLLHFLECTDESCDYFLSTPCWNGSAAENHINEMTYHAFGSLLENVGFKIENVYGTFASISDYKSNLDCVKTTAGGFKQETDLTGVFSALREYYDTNVLAVIFAPLFPDKSRNCLWHLRRKTGDDAKQISMFEKLEFAPKPWSMHPKWEELCG